MTDPPICAPHPVETFPPEATDLLSSIAGRPVLSIGPPPGASTLEEVVEAIEGQRRSRGIERWVVWGMSGGSFLGQIYAQRYPTALSGLILASSGPYFRPTVEDPACILCPRHPSRAARLAAAGLLEGPSDRGPTEWQLVDGVGWVFRRAGGAALLVSLDEPSAELRRMMPALWAFDARPWLGGVDLPALALCGTVDPIVPLAHARALADALPRARFETIAGAGHIPLTENRREVERAVRSFLAELGRRPASPPIWTPKENP